MEKEIRESHGWHINTFRPYKLTRKTIIFLQVMLFVLVSAKTYAVEVDGIYYLLDSSSKTAKVSYKTTAYNSYSGSVTIPEKFIYEDVEYTVTSIGMRAFRDCGDLTSVSIPNSVCSIEAWAFRNCRNLTSVNIPVGVTSIGQETFRKCSSLTSIVIPNTVTDIGPMAFEDCSGLTSMNIPNSVTSIGKDAFRDCNGLTSVTIPSSVTSIGESAFSGCGNLTSITIPNSVTSIVSGTFRYCRGLTSMNIPNSIISIGSYAFYGCTGLTSVAIPSSVTSIGECAFYSCTRIAEIHSMIIEPFETDNNCWNGVSKNIPLYVPAGSKAKYQATSGWNEFTNIIEATHTGVTINSTTFPDDAFRSWVFDNVSGASDGILTDKEIAAVTSIKCNARNIRNMKGIEYFTALQELYCGANGITNLDVRKNTALTVLNCEGNQLTTLDITNNTKLTSLYCGNNKLTKLDVTNNTSLIELKCFDNQLTTLYVSKNTELKTLNCSSNKLTILDVSNFTALISLDCYSNQLMSLDVTKNTALTYLNCSSNQLTTLDVSKNIALRLLHCYSNQLTALDVTNNTALTDFLCGDNQLLYLDLSKNKYINSTHPIVGIVSPQSTTLTAVDISAGIGIPVPMGFNMAKVSNLKLNGTSVSGSVTTVNGQNYLVFATKGTAQSSIDGKTLTYNYSTGSSFSQAASMDVSVTLSYTATTVNYSLSIQSGSGGSVLFKNSTITNTTKTFMLEEGASAIIYITPNYGYQLNRLTVNGLDVTSYVWNNSYTIDNITENTNVVVSFEQIPTTTYSLSIQSGNGGTVSYEGTTISNTTKSFTINEGSSATISIYPNSGYQLSKLTVNGNNVTSYVTNNQYTINSITANTVVAVSFAASSTSFTQNGIYYHISSASNKTLNVNSGAYNGHLTIPASVSYDGSTWSVRGAESGVFNSSSITAITWNPSYSINSDAFGTQTNPNLLLYVKSESYAPSNVPNVIVNGKSKKIVLTDAASGNDFDCPEAFTATEISYTHKYRMTTGIGECRGWETIALPFDVKLFTHESKETLIPFKVFSSASSGKPFWLYQLTSNGWQEAATIEANKPYIISMPNNKSYYNNYNMNGEVTFSAKNITVPKTEPIETKFNDRTFVANFKSQQSAWDIYALNVNNEYSSYNEYLPEGSTFIRELRTVHPFEAFMMSTAANAKDMFGIFEDLTTAIKQLPTIGEDGNKHIRIYNLEGQLVKEVRNVSEKEALKGLRHGLYIVNGKKRIIK